MRHATVRQSPRGLWARSRSTAAYDPANDFELQLRHFRDSFSSRPYGRGHAWFEDYEPAYRMGYVARGRFLGLDFVEIEPQLEAEWYSTQPSTALTWQQVRMAAHDAWERRAELKPKEVA